MPSHSSPYDSIAIIAAMRTGSQLLEAILNQHEHIQSFGELFNPVFIGNLQYKERFGMTVQTRDADPYALLQAVGFEATDNKLPIYRIFDEHNFDVLDYILKNPRIYKIILRRNPLDSFVSLKIAVATNQWQSKRERANATALVDLDADEYRAYFQKNLEFFDYCETVLEDTEQESFALRYEQIKNITVINNILSDIGLEPLDRFFETMAKQNRPVAEQVVNPEILDDLPQYEPAIALKMGKHSPIIDNVFIAQNCELAFVPLTLHSLSRELEYLEAANGEPLKMLDTASVQAWLTQNENRKAYSRIFDPQTRFHGVFNDQIHGHDTRYWPLIEHIFEREYPELNVQLPLSENLEEMQSQGVTEGIFKNVEVIFAREVFQELWNSRRRFIHDDWLWPQCYLFENMKQWIPSLEIVLGVGAPPNIDIAWGSVSHRVHFGPFKNFKYQNNLMVKLFREDYEYFGMVNRFLEKIKAEEIEKGIVHE